MLKLKQTLLAAVFSGIGLLSVSTLANAATPGFYVGGGAGWGDTHYNADFVKGEKIYINYGYAPTSVNKKDSGISGRLFTGYQFNQNWAIELGYNRFHDASVKYSFGPGAVGALTADKITIQQQAIDLVGKGIVPLEDGFSLYGKVGLAYVIAKVKDTEVYQDADPIHSNGHEQNILPTFGIGASYDLTKNVPVSIGWDHIQRIGHTGIKKVGDTAIRNTDMATVSIAYNFD